MLKQLDATNKMMEDRNLFQFAFNNARILEKNNTFYIESFEERNGRICGSGTAYYPNQITITGNFQNDYPCGRCTLTFGHQDCFFLRLLHHGNRLVASTLLTRRDGPCVGLLHNPEEREVKKTFLIGILRFIRS